MTRIFFILNIFDDKFINRMSQLLLVLILNLFSITNPKDSLTTVSDKSIVYESYYTPNEQLLLENKIADRLLDPIWMQHRLKRKNPLFFEYYRYFDIIRRDEFDNINYLDLDKNKHSLATKFIFEYRIKAEIKIPFVSFYDDNYIYHDRTTCLKRHCFSSRINNYTITPIVNYDYKGKLKKKDFLNKSFLNKLKYPENKQAPWFSSYFILENKENKTIEITNLENLQSYTSSSFFYPYYKELLNIKDSLYINKLFHINSFISQILFGISENGEIYIFDYSSRKKKWSATKLEDYIRDTPQSLN